MNSHQFKNTTTKRTESLALIRCIYHQCKLRKYLFMAGIKRRSLDRKPITYFNNKPNNHVLKKHNNKPNNKQNNKPNNKPNNHGLTKHERKRAYIPRAYTYSRHIFHSTCGMQFRCIYCRMIVTEKCNKYIHFLWMT